MCVWREELGAVHVNGGDAGGGVAEEISSSLGGKDGATLACSITWVGGTCAAGASPRCPSACKQEIQPNDKVDED